jgi:3-methyl-2-oxobutanoate hydroxymethyltransferase
MEVAVPVVDEDSEEEAPPKHAHAFGNLARLHKQMYQERVAAMKAFHDEVKARNFPYPETNVSMHSNEKEKFLEALDKE